MKLITAISLIFVAGLPLLANGAEGPNVIVVMADDISAHDFPIYGSSTCYGERAETPVIARLAIEGCYLTTAWSSTVCMPTRAEIMGTKLPTRDGKGAWWAASKLPANMDSFPQIKNLNQLSPAQNKEKAMIEEILKRFARTDIGGTHSFHADPSRKLTERKIEKMRLKREHLEKHLKSFK